MYDRVESEEEDMSELLNVEDIFAEKVFTIMKMKERLPKKVFQEVMNVSEHGGELSMATADVVAKAMKDFRIRVVGTSGFDQSQVTKGGVDTNDVNPFTLKSKLQRDLYLVGELLNVDGECGGYNLSFAYHSGVKCAKAIKDKMERNKDL